MNQKEQGSMKRRIAVPSGVLLLFVGLTCFAFVGTRVKAQDQPSVGTESASKPGPAVIQNPRFNVRRAMDQARRCHISAASRFTKNHTQNTSRAFTREGLRTRDEELLASTVTLQMAI